MTSKYVTESRAGHVTFPRVFPIGLWGVRYSLYYILLVVDYPQIISLAKPKLVFHYTTFCASHGNYPVELNLVIVHSGNIH